MLTGLYGLLEYHGIKDQEVLQQFRKSSVLFEDKQDGKLKYLAYALDEPIVLKNYKYLNLGRILAKKNKEIPEEWYDKHIYSAEVITKNKNIPWKIMYFFYDHHDSKKGFTLLQSSVGTKRIFKNFFINMVD